MKKKISLGILLLSVCVIVWFDIDAHMRKNRLLEVLSQQGTVVLMPSVTKALLADLKSEDPDRMKQWHGYIYMCAGFNSNLIVQAATVQEALALYVSKERPARSNYFNHLVFALKQQASFLSRKDLLDHLGDPDFTLNDSRGEMLQYAYRWYGGDCLASAIVSNGTVVQIDIYAK